MIDHLNDAALRALPDDAPVVMLNLMRFRERSLDGLPTVSVIWPAPTRMGVRGSII